MTATSERSPAEGGDTADHDLSAGAAEVPLGQDGSVTTLGEWESELHGLRSDLGTVQPMQVTWLPRRDPRLRYPLLCYGLKRFPDEEVQILGWDVAVYPSGASRRTSPVLLVDVAADAPLPLKQPLAVEVAGRLEPGAAIAFRLPRGDVVFGTSPARRRSSSLER